MSKSNRNKRILVITYYWPPSGGAGVQRWVKFCKYLPEFGIEPVVLTVENGTYPLVDESLSKEVPDDLQVFRSRSLEPYSLFARITGRTRKEVSTPATAFSTEGGILQKLGVWIRSNIMIPDARRGWVPFTVSKAKTLILELGIDTVVTTAPPNSTHLIGTRLKEWNPGLKWIMDMRDPWSKIFYNESLPRTSIAQQLDEALERKALSMADEVVVISESMKKLESEIHPRAYHPIPNGFDHADFTDPPEEKKKEKYVIKYVGSMTPAAIPYHFFEALSGLDHALRKKLSLTFYGSYTSKVREAIEQYGLQEITSFRGYLPHLEAKKEMQTADLLLLVIPDTKDNELILTGKIFDYIGAQKPVFCIGPVPGDASDIIDTYDLGVSFEYHETKAMQDWIVNQLGDNPSPYNKWQGSLKDHPFSRYSLSRRMSELILKEKSR